MTSAAPLLVIQNDPTCPLGYFAEWFAAAGLGVDVRHAFAQDELPGDAGGFAGAVVLGGEMGADDDAAYPWLAPTKALIRSAVQREIPLLGICLGHQLVAAALGGVVARNPSGRAAGLTPVTLTDTGRADPLLGASRAGAHAIQWNSDMVTRLPDGAEVLATCPDGTPQAIRFARRAWGVQFHPEASPAIFDSWFADGSAADADGVAPDDAGEPTADRAASRIIAAAEPELRRDWRGLADRFAGICTAGAL